MKIKFTPAQLKKAKKAIRAADRTVQRMENSFDREARRVEARIVRLEDMVHPNKEQRAELRELNCYFDKLMAAKIYG